MTASRPGAGAAGRSRRRRAVVTIGVLLVVAASAGGAARAITSGGHADSAGRAPAPVATDEVLRGDLQGVTTVSGTLTFSGRRSVQAGHEGTVTHLPAPGSVLTRGDRVYAVDDDPTVLLAGQLPAWRDLAAGMSDGPDVRQLEENLRELGHFTEEPDERFRWATTQAVMEWQEATGRPRTGRLPLGSVVFAPEDLRVGEIRSAVGTRVVPGDEVFAATGTTRVVEAGIRLSDQQLAALGTAVTVQLPGGQTVAGRITSVETPTEVDGTDGRKQTVVPVVIALDDPTLAAAFQQASVTVTIPSEIREDVLSVPVGALLAITPDEHGVEIVHPDGTSTTVPVTTGLFAGGRVEISGDGVEAGQRVVVPQR